jgi:hypothetical protein
MNSLKGFEEVEKQGKMVLDKLKFGLAGLHKNQVNNNMLKDHPNLLGVDTPQGKNEGQISLGTPA